MKLILLSLSACAMALVLASPVLADTTPCSLTWAANTESDLKGYRIYKQGQPTPLAQVPKTTTSYDCSGVSDNAVHQFFLTAIDDAGERTDTTRNPNGDNESLPSVIVQKLFLGAPTAFQVTGVTFTWGAVTGATAYALRVHEDGTPTDPCSALVFCADVVGTSQTMTLKPGTKYDVLLFSKSGTSISSSTGFTFTTPVIDIISPAAPGSVVIQ